MKEINFLIAVIVITGAISGCVTINGNKVIDLQPTQAVFNETLPLEVAKLSKLDLQSVNTFEEYKEVVDTINSLIIILNEKSDLFEIHSISTTHDAWQKASKIIEEFAPLINNYNEAVQAAKDYELKKDEAHLKSFYVKAGKFGIETALIFGAVYYKAAYELTGVAYRAMKLQKIAPGCAECVRAILSKLHWTIRNTLVEGSSSIAEKVAEGISNK